MTPFVTMRRALSDRHLLGDPVDAALQSAFLADFREVRSAASV